VEVAEVMAVTAAAVEAAEAVWPSAERVGGRRRRSMD
jgi:hypothetical protein